MAGDLLQFLLFPFTKILPFLIVLTVIVFIHEMGHFLVARWCGVAVQAFSIGFGKEIWGFNDKHGTRWRLAWIPLGGYVKFMGDSNAASVPSPEDIARMSPEERATNFHAKPVWQRSAIVAAGPIANFLLAILIFAVWFSVFGVQSIEPRIGYVGPNTPAERAGFVPDDLIVAIDGNKIVSFQSVLETVTNRLGSSMTFTVDRQGQQLDLTVVPEMIVPENEKQARPVIGIRPVADAKLIKVSHPNPLEAVKIGVDQTWFIAVSTLTYIKDVVTGRRSADQLGGPIRIADVSAKVAEQDPLRLVNLIALISVSIGLMNLFPIPLLDGGHLMFYAIEAIRRRPLSEQAQEIGFRIGFAIVLMLMIFATFNDLEVVKSWFTGG